MKDESVLTIRVRIVNKESAEWIWTSHKTPCPLNGVQVTAVAWGDLFVERDELLERVEDLEDEADDPIAGLKI